MPLPPVELRPQSVLLTFFGDFVAGEDEGVSASDVVELLEGAGIGASATRATVNRMVKRGLLRRVAIGRQAWFGLTPFGRRTVLDGRERAQAAEAHDAAWDGRWTLVSFSLPESAQRERHELRARLTWAGFGMVQAGLWAAPRRVDVDEVLEELARHPGLNAFRAETLAPTDGRRLVQSAYDIDALASRHTAFVDRWSPVVGADAVVSDPLLARVVLSTDWLMLLRDDPRLPLEFLPHPWPGQEARRLHHALEGRLRAPAAREARRRLAIRELPAPR